MFPDVLYQGRQMKIKLSVLQIAADSSILRARQVLCALLPDVKTHFSSLNFLLMNCVPLGKKGKLNLISSRGRKKSHLPCVIYLLKWFIIQTNGVGGG